MLHFHYIGFTEVSDEATFKVIQGHRKPRSLTEKIYVLIIVQ